MAPDMRTARREYDRFDNLSAGIDGLQRMQPEATQSLALTRATVEVPARAKSTSAARPASVVQQQHTSVDSKAGSRGRMSPPPPNVITRDFAQPQTLVRANPPEVMGGLQSETTNDIHRLTNGTRRNIALGGYIHIDRQELGSQGSDLDQIIAVKKEAAARALLKLQEVMAMPTWEEPCGLGRSKTSSTIPSRWRDLSVEDGSPIAPSSIFNKVKMPAFTPPLSQVSTYLEREGRGLEQSHERSRQEGVELNHETLSDSNTKSDVQGSAASSESPRPPWLEKRGTSETVVPTLKKSHSRVGSTMSANSGTSAYSLPHHMVPARGSSLRNGEGSIDDLGPAPRLYIGDLGWQ